jgi:hypothetical protein
MRDQKQGPAPFSLRLSESERGDLMERAAGEPLSGYIRSQLFPDGRRLYARSAIPTYDRTLLAQAMGKLGQAELAKSLRQLATAARVGALTITPETEQALFRASADIANIRSMLMAALRIDENNP